MTNEMINNSLGSDQNRPPAGSHIAHPSWSDLATIWYRVALPPTAAMAAVAIRVRKPDYTLVRTGNWVARCPSI